MFLRADASIWGLEIAIYAFLRAEDADADYGTARPGCDLPSSTGGRHVHLDGVDACALPGRACEDHDGGCSVQHCDAGGCDGHVRDYQPVEIVTYGTCPAKNLGGLGGGDGFVLVSIGALDAAHILATFLVLAA